MPDFSTLAGGAMQSAVSTAASTGIAVSDASTDTKGSWVELIAATSYPTAWMHVMASSVGSADSFLADIGIGAGSAEKVLIPDLLLRNLQTAARASRNWIMPISIPSGSRLSTRCASSTAAADTMQVAIMPIAGHLASVAGPCQAEGFGANATGSTGTQIDPGGSANTVGSWVQLIAATTIPYRWITLSFTCGTLAAVTEWLVELAVGAAAAEKVLMSPVYTGSGATSDAPTPGSVSLPILVPAGSRIAARAQCSVNTVTERLLFVSGQGFG